MAAIALDNAQARLAQEAAWSRRVMRWALWASLVVHIGALALFSAVHLRPLPLPQGPRLIEVRLLEPAHIGASVDMAPSPLTAAAPPERPPLTQAGPAARPSAPSKPMREPARPKAPPLRAVSPRPRAAAPGAGPSPGPGRPSRASAQQPAPAPAVAPDVGLPGVEGNATGADVGLGSGSRQGDLPGPGTGSGAPTGTVPSGGAGGGIGTGSGPGGSVRAGPGTGAGPGGGTGGSGTGAGDGGAPGGEGGAGLGGAGSGGAGHVSRLADRKIPVLVRRVNPAYPVAAQVEGVEGTVRLLVTVSKEGAVAAVRVARSSGDARLDAAAVAAVKQWRYQPAVQDGIARTVDTYATVTFSLE